MLHIKTLSVENNGYLAKDLSIGTTFRLYIKALFKSKSYDTVGNGMKVGLYDSSITRYRIILVDKSDGVYLAYYNGTDTIYVKIHDNNNSMHEYDIQYDGTNLVVLLDGTQVVSVTDYAHGSGTMTLYIGDVSSNYICGDLYIDRLTIESEIGTVILDDDFSDVKLANWTVTGDEILVIQDINIANITNDRAGNYVIDAPYIFMIMTTGGKVIWLSDQDADANLVDTLDGNYNLFYPEFETNGTVYTPFNGSGTVTISADQASRTLTVIWDTDVQTVTAVFQFYDDKKYFKLSITRSQKITALLSNAQFCSMYSNVFTTAGILRYDTYEFIESYNGYPDTTQTVNGTDTIGYKYGAIILKSGTYNIGMMFRPSDNNPHVWSHITKLTNNNTWEVQIGFFGAHDLDAIYIEEGTEYGAEILYIVTKDYNELSTIISELKSVFITDITTQFYRANESIRQTTNTYSIFAVTPKFVLNTKSSGIYISYKPLINNGGKVYLGISALSSGTGGHDPDYKYAYITDGTDKYEVYILDNMGLRITSSKPITLSPSIYTITSRNGYYEVDTGNGKFYIRIIHGIQDGLTINPASNVVIDITDVPPYRPSRKKTNWAPLIILGILGLLMFMRKK